MCVDMGYAADEWPSTAARASARVSSARISEPNELGESSPVLATSTAYRCLAGTHSQDTIAKHLLIADDGPY
jgi:hypothetical protein